MVADIKSMAGINTKTIKTLFARSGNICAFPGCNTLLVDSVGNVIGEICHIAAQSPGGPRYDVQQTEAERHGVDNLLLLCANHHKTIDGDEAVYPIPLLKGMKEAHEGFAGRDYQKSDDVNAQRLLEKFSGISIAGNRGHVAVASPGAIQTDSLNLQVKNGSVSIELPKGTIGSNASMVRYLEYLIRRYNEFASKDYSRKTKFSYGALSRNIENNFGAKWKLLDESRFEDVCGYVQGRISRTRIAKANGAKGRRAFSSYDVFREKYAKK